jgi:dolichyl-diphosphooligosaccharide--protein glycosyltransferase
MLACILLLALALRMLAATYALSGGQVHFNGLDSYYHMRRIVYTVYHFPSTNVFDSYVNYPSGFPIYWPPLFDQIAAGLSLLVGLGRPDRYLIDLVSATVPVIIGVLSIVLLYFLVKDTMGKYAALVAALIMAIIPGAISPSQFASTDHHVLEVLLSLTMYLLFMRAVTSARVDQVSFKNIVDYKKTLAYAALAGILIAAMVFAWDGAPILISVIILYAFLQYAYDAYNKNDSLYLTVAGSISALVALAIIAPLAATGYGGVGFQVTPLMVSWFHIIYLLAAFLFFLAMGTMSVAFARHRVPWYALPGAALAFACTLLLGLRLVTPEFFNGVSEGFTFLIGGNMVLRTVQEIEPLFLNVGKFSLLVPWAFFSTAMILSMLGLLAFLLTVRGRKLQSAEIFFLVWTAVVLILGLLQKRFVYLLAVNISIFSGYALFVALDLAGLGKQLATHDAHHARSRQKSKSGSIAPALVVMATLSFMLLVPLLIGGIGMALTPEYYMADWNDACSWVKDNTPPTSYTYEADAGTHPEYGIMSWWDYGNYILYKAERPAIANNFQTGIEKASLFFTAQNETAADALMNNCSARYVMVDDRMGSPYAGVPNGIFENMAYLAGDDPASYHIHDNVSSKRVIILSPKYNNSMYARLFNFDGCGYRSETGNVTGGLEHYRLIYATDGADPVKVFEYVKGARITGKASPGSAVELSLNLTLPDSERTYYGKTTAGEDGLYAFVVPYPSAGGSYEIRSGDDVSHAEVPESAVSGGGTVTAE